MILSSVDKQAKKRKNKGKTIEVGRIHHENSVLFDLDITV